MVRAAIQDVRNQLSLFVPAGVGAPIESLRTELDPVQARLIPAHVTLCREDEITELFAEDILRRLRGFGASSITLRFGTPVSFDGHGILLPCIGGATDFTALRHCILGGRARDHVPHITLAHPRNPRAAGNRGCESGALPPGIEVTFTAVTQIRQVGGSTWRVIREFSFGEGT